MELMFSKLQWSELDTKEFKLVIHCEFAISCLVWICPTLTLSTNQRLVSSTHDHFQPIRSLYDSSILFTCFSHSFLLKFSGVRPRYFFAKDNLYVYYQELDNMLFLIIGMLWCFLICLRVSASWQGVSMWKSGALTTNERPVSRSCDNSGPIRVQYHGAL